MDGRARKAERRFDWPMLVVGLAFWILAATAEARPVPEPVRDQVFRASVQVGVGALNEVPGTSVDVKVAGRYTRCPRPKRGLYACTLTVRTLADGQASACSVVVAASRKRWAWKAFGCPTTWGR